MGKLVSAISSNGLQQVAVGHMLGHLGGLLDGPDDGSGNCQGQQRTQYQGQCSERQRHFLNVAMQAGGFVGALFNEFLLRDRERPQGVQVSGLLGTDVGQQYLAGAHHVSCAGRAGKFLGGNGGVQPGVDHLLQGRFTGG